MHTLQGIFQWLKSLSARDPALIAAFLLVTPNLTYAFLDKGMWTGDPMGYAMYTLGLYRNLFTDQCRWLSMMFGGFKAPLILWAGQVFAAIGHATGMMRPSLLLLPVGAYLVAVLLTFRTGERLFASRYIAFCGALLLTGSPLVHGLSNGFWIEPLQVAVVAWFIYALTRVGSWSWVETAGYLIIGGSGALLTKVSSPLYLLLPGILLLAELFGKKFPKALSPKEKLLLIISVSVLLPTVVFYTYNLTRLIEFARFASQDPIFGDDVSRIELWHQYLNGGLFNGFTYTFGILLLLLATGMMIRAGFIRQQLFVPLLCLGQIALFFGAWVSSVNVDPRYFAPALPYFGLLICWSLHVLQIRVLTALAVGLFSIQFVATTGFSFGLVSGGSPYGMIRPLEPTDRMTEMMKELMPLAARDSAIIFDTNPELSGFEFQYLLAERDIFGNWPQSSADVSLFFGLVQQRIDTLGLDVDSVWAGLMSFGPDYYITWASRLDTVLIQKEIQRIDRYHAATVHVRWAIASRVNCSGEFLRIPYDRYPELTVFRRLTVEDLHKRSQSE